MRASQVLRAMLSTILAVVFQTPAVVLASILVGLSLVDVPGYKPTLAYFLTITLLALLALLWALASYFACFFAGFLAGEFDSRNSYAISVGVAMADLLLIIRLGGYYWLSTLFSRALMLPHELLPVLFVGLLLVLTIFCGSKGYYKGAPRQ